jgi:hypothetical protein
MNMKGKVLKIDNRARKLSYHQVSDFKIKYKSNPAYGYHEQLITDQ